MRLLAVQALQGACLNGHREIIKELREEETPGEIAADLETERTKIARFISRSREFFFMLSDTVERGTLLKVCIIQSCRMIGATSTSHTLSYEGIRPISKVVFFLAFKLNLDKLRTKNLQIEIFVKKQG
jgi:nitrate/nitrite-specific signal transduction histidine kinase